MRWNIPHGTTAAEPSDELVKLAHKPGKAAKHAHFNPTTTTLNQSP